WDGFVESGQGMGATLVMADQMHGYVLADRGTYLKFKDKMRLKPLGRTSESLRNPYGAIVVKPNEEAAGQLETANAFVDFLISREAQMLIRNYKLHGEQLFHPSRLEE
ncbi:MAG: substrate-binding domain-containing protein, partial [Planctomycetaceae bacterium]